MQKSIKKILSLLLAIVLVAGLVPWLSIPASAADITADYYLYFDTTSHTFKKNSGGAEIASDELAGFSYVWNDTDEKLTITLDNFNFTTTSGTALRTTTATDIVLIGESSLNAAGTGTSSFGISSTGGLAFSGNGTLAASSADLSGDTTSSYGIFLYSGTMSITGAAKVTAAAGSSTFGCAYGHASSGDAPAVVAKGSSDGGTTFDADAFWRNNRYYTAADSWTEFSHMQFTALPDYTLYYEDGKMYTYDIYSSSGDPKIDEVTDMSGWSGDGTTLTLDGFSFFTTAEVGLIVADGTTISLLNDNSITSSPITAQGCESLALIAGNKFDGGTLTFTGTGKLTASGGDAEDGSCGIFTPTALNIQGGEIYAIAGDGDSSFGIMSTSMSITSGKLTAQSGIGYEISAALYVINEIENADVVGRIAADGENEALTFSTMIYGLGDPFTPAPYAVVTAKSTSNPPIIIAPKPAPHLCGAFTDIAGHWGFDAICYVIENGVMNGTGSETFAPNSKLSRAMMAQILYNLEGKPAVSGESFTDVASDAWYADAVTWASANGIVNGYGNGKFGPEKSITREEMAAILYRYCEYKGITLPTTRTGEFADSGLISSWAVDAINALYQAEILNGKSDNSFAPQGSASRAEVAQMMMNFLKATK